MSALEDWRPKEWAVEDEIRILLKALRRKDTSTKACRKYAKGLVQSVVKGWELGDELTPKQAQKVGAEFDRQLLRTGRKIPRLELPPFKHRP